MKNVLKVIFVIIGTTIGAGFASGQEIYLFFNKYGVMGIAGMVISCTITGYIVYKVFKIIRERSIKSYSEFLSVLSSNKKLNKTMQIIIQCFLLMSFFVMIAGFSAYFNQEFQILIYIPAVCISVLCYITFRNNTKGIVYINTILIPFLCVFICYLGIKNIDFVIGNNSPINYCTGWLFSSILYASYNSILLIPILIELNAYIKRPSQAKICSILCSSILCVLGLILYFLLLRGSNYVQNLELPLIQITKEYGNIYSVIYGVVILIAIFTTAIASGYGFIKNINKNDKLWTIVICIISVLVVPVGFSNLVGLLYPIFGVLGLIQIWAILKVKYL